MIEFCFALMVWTLPDGSVHMASRTYDDLCVAREADLSAWVEYNINQGWWTQGEFIFWDKSGQEV